jgi:hypothetical protein
VQFRTVEFVGSGVVSARNVDFITRLAAQRVRRADLEHEIVLVARQVSTVDRRVMPADLARLSEVIALKLRPDEPALRQGYARRLEAEVVVAPDVITIFGTTRGA